MAPLRTEPEMLLRPVFRVHQVNELTCIHWLALGLAWFSADVEN